MSVSTTDRSIALFGGIYSNHHALRAAIGDARERGATELYCLGDLGAFGPHPDRVFPLLDEHRIRVVAGNYDDSIARSLGDCQCGYTDPRDNHFARLSYAYTLANTSSAHRLRLATLPREIRLELEGRRVLLCHGSPRRQNEFLWESTSPDPFLEALCHAHDADIVCVTHTGIHWSRRLPSGRLVVNVGVLGRPENDGTRDVWYAILRGSSGEVTVEFRRIAYDWPALASEMRAEGLPREFIETIETGWWTTCLEVLPAKERERGRY